MQRREKLLLAAIGRRARDMYLTVDVDHHRKKKKAASTGELRRIPRGTWPVRTRWCPTKASAGAALAARVTGRSLQVDVGGYAGSPGSPTHHLADQLVGPTHREPPAGQVQAILQVFAPRETPLTNSHLIFYPCLIPILALPCPTHSTPKHPSTNRFSQFLCEGVRACSTLFRAGMKPRFVFSTERWQ